MASMNIITVLGNLATAPKLADVRGDNKTCTFFVAVNERKRKDGTQPDANFIPVKTWNGQAESCSKYLTVGSEVLVTGRLVTSRYEKDGETKYGWEVVANDVTFLRRPKGDNGGEMTSETFTPSTEAPPAAAPASDSDIPF